MVFPVGENEAARLDALRELSVLDSAKEPVFDSIVELARQQFRVPICLISLVDEERQWFKAVCGLGIDSTPRELAFCNYTILENKPFIVEDAKKDARFANNALVTGAPFIRFYAGVPLTIAGNLNVGSLCVIDQRPRVFGTNEIARLADLARIVVRLLEQSKTVKMMERLGEELNTERATLVARKTDMEFMSNLAKIGEWCVNLATMDVFWSNEVRRIHEVNEDYQPTFETAVNFYHETVRQKLKDGLRECVETGRPWDCAGVRRA